MPAKTDYILHSVAPSGDSLVLKNPVVLTLDSHPTNGHVSSNHTTNTHVRDVQVAESSIGPSRTLLEKFIHAQKELEAYR